MAEGSGVAGLLKDGALVAEDNHLLPLPAAASSSSQASFTMSEVLAGVGRGRDLAQDLSPDVASADLRIATDGSYVETTFAPAAFELKRRWDFITGAGKNGVISPYAITSVQHDGQQYFRVSDRKTHAIVPEPKAAPKHRSHKSRLSVGSFLPQTIFKSNGSTTPDRSSRRLSSSATSTSHSYSQSSPSALRPSGSFTDINSNLDSSSIPVPNLDSDVSSSVENSSVIATSRSSSVPSSSRQSLKDIFRSRTPDIPSSTTYSYPANAKRGPLPDSLSFVTEEDRSSTPILTPKPSNYNSIPNIPGRPLCFPFSPHVISYTDPSAIPLSTISPPRPEKDRPFLREAASFDSTSTARFDPTSTARFDLSDLTMNALRPLDGNGLQSPSLPSTEIWDAIQGYYGRVEKQPETPSDGSEAAFSIPVIAPPVDPRFVIWGKVQLDHTISPSTSPAVSRKRSDKSKASSKKSSYVRVPERVIVAATIERWVAQFTSEIDWTELHSFLLTYRQFISPIDLFHLLACRFAWTLEPPRNAKDEIVRKVVRIRTFTAIRYWLETFFREDFIPNRKLCSLCTLWVNALGRDPAFTKFPESKVLTKFDNRFNCVLFADVLWLPFEQGIQKKLKKSVRLAKEKYGHEGKDVQKSPIKEESSIDDEDEFRYTGHPSSAYSFVLRRNSEPITPSLTTTDTTVQETAEDDMDVDLDFSTVLEETTASIEDVDSTSSPRKRSAEQSRSRAGSLSRGDIGPGVGSSIFTPKESGSSSQSNMQPITLLPPSLNGLSATNLPEPTQHGPISRAFVKTIHSLSRWKRVLNSRSAIPTPLTCADASAFDVEFNPTGDLLIVRGGVEQYLRWLEVPPSSINLAGHDEEHLRMESAHLESIQIPSQSTSSVDAVSVPSQTDGESVEIGTFVSDLPASSEVDDDDAEVPEDPVRPEIVSLDDFEFSDSDGESQAGGRPLRRLPRRLPLRRDLETTRHSVDTLSSVDSHDHDSRLSFSAVTDISELSGTDQALPSEVIQEWQIDLIESDEDEAPGDAEAALRRLEGQIDLTRQRQKDLKVATWMRTVELIKAGEEIDPPSRAITSGADADDQVEGESRTLPPGLEETIASPSSKLANDAPPVPKVSEAPSAVDSRASQYTALYPPSESRDSTTPTPSDAASVIDMSRAQQSAPTGSQAYSMPRSSLVQKASLLTSIGTRIQHAGKFSAPAYPAVHRSFILLSPSDALAQQFCLIERDLLLRVKLDEVVSMNWLEHTEKTLSVVDWIPFYKDRMKLKTKQGHIDSFAGSDLYTLRARFTLMENFTASEVVLTHPNERAVVVAKFIRVAWKLYRMNNFSALVAVMRGLQSKPVEISMRKMWNRVGMWESRIFRDLKVFTSAEDNFRFVREATVVFSSTVRYHDTLFAVGGIPGINKARGLDSVIPCVPFLGIYLNEIKEITSLPDFVDPSSPRDPVDFNPSSKIPGPIRRPTVFSGLEALPSSLPLKPLINVHKQRLLASTFRSFVAGQYLALNYPPNSQDGKLYHKCWRLRCLDNDTLMQVASMYSQN